jgi:hypothetical protein
MIFGAVVVVPPFRSAGHTRHTAVAAVDAVVVPLCSCPVLLVFPAGAVLVVELPLFFLALVLAVVWPMAIDPVTRNALIQKLAANFK